MKPAMRVARENTLIPRGVDKGQAVTLAPKSGNLP